MPKKKKLDMETLVREAARFAEVESAYGEPGLCCVTDGKAKVFSKSVGSLDDAG